MELVGAKPLHLLTQTVPSLKSPHWGFCCPACGVAVLFKSSYPHAKKHSTQSVLCFQCG